MPQHPMKIGSEANSGELFISFHHAAPGAGPGFSGSPFTHKEESLQPSFTC